MSGRKNFSSIPLDLVIGSLWIKLIKDILTGEKTNSKSHIFAGAHRKMWLKEAVRIWSLYTILIEEPGNSLAVQWLVLCASTAGGSGSVPGWEAKILQAAQHGQLKKKMQLIPVFLFAKSHRQRSLVGYSPCSLKESDMTEQLSTTTQLSLS